MESVGKHPAVDARTWQDVPHVASLRRLGCWEGRREASPAGAPQAPDRRGGWGAVLQVQGAQLCHPDMESCNVELIFDHIGHFGR